MKKSILSVFVMFVSFSCQEKDAAMKSTSEDGSIDVKKEVLKLSDIVGDTLRYEVGEPVFDIVISSDTTLYWKSFKPKFGTEAHERIVVIPISEHENMVSYVENEGGGPGVCWYNDFERGITTVTVFVGKKMMTFSGSVKRKHKKD